MEKLAMSVIAMERTNREILEKESEEVLARREITGRKKTRNLSIKESFRLHTLCCVYRIQVGNCASSFIQLQARLFSI